MFTTLLLFVFLATVAVLAFLKLRPRDNSVLQTLASNRLRIEFVPPPPPKNKAQEIFLELKNTLDTEGYDKSLQLKLEGLNQEFLKQDKHNITSFLAVDGALILICKFVGVTGFQLSKRKRTPQDYETLDATVAVLKTFAEVEEGLEALSKTNEAAYDLYIAASYAKVSTRANVLDVLARLALHSEETYSGLLQSAEDYMYIPGDEEFLFADLVKGITESSPSDESLDYAVAGLSYLEALLTSPHAKDKKGMLADHFLAVDLEAKLEPLRSVPKASEIVDRLVNEYKATDPVKPTFHTTPYDKRSCYSHQFASRVRWFARTLNCLYSTLPATLPIGKGALQRFTDEYREQAIERMNRLKELKRSGNYNAEEIQKFNREMSALTLGVSNDFFDHMMESGMFEETRKFIDKAESIENWNHEELLQAGRNVWTCFGLQMIVYKQAVTMSDAYLGYSLLYPYTDNYLDDDSISKEDKRTFQDLFTRRLAGDQVKARSVEEQKIWDCVTLIENRFDRSKFPNAFNSLIAINEAQTKSLRQHTKDVPPEELIVEISMEKGGTSVLADGYLVEGDMTEEDALFSFGLGVALQLVDDLQDTSRDIAVHQHTMFTVPFLNKQPCDAHACRLLRLMETIVNPEYYDLDEAGEKLRYAMLKMTNTIAMKAIAKYCYIFSEEFVEEVAMCAPIPLTFLSRVNNMARMLQMVRSNQI